MGLQVGSCVDAGKKRKTYLVFGQRLGVGDAWTDTNHEHRLTESYRITLIICTVYVYIYMIKNKTYLCQFFLNLIVLYFMYLFIHIHRNMFSRVFYVCPVWLVYPDAQDITWKTVHWNDLQLSLGHQ